MNLSYGLIAEWVEPVAEKACGGRHLSLGGMALRLSVAEEWEADCGNDEQVEADLACMELVRRLNRADWSAMICSASVWFYQSNEEDRHSPYTTHPLEAVAAFCKEVGA